MSGGFVILCRPPDFRNGENPHKTFAICKLARPISLVSRTASSGRPQERRVGIAKPDENHLSSVFVAVFVVLRGCFRVVPVPIRSARDRLGTCLNTKNHEEHENCHERLRSPRGGCSQKPSSAAYGVDALSATTGIDQEAHRLIGQLEIGQELLARAKVHVTAARAWRAAP
jgi:hypothetical protein